MAHTFEYAVLMAIPDASRGERVNVGIVVFLPERVDVRFAELAKVRALTGNDWNDYANDAAARLAARFSSGAKAKDVLEREPAFDPVFHVSDVARFAIPSVADYESRVKEVLQALVVRPKSVVTRPKSTRFNTEIAKVLRHSKLLAKRDEIIDSHKVVRDYVVEDELRADFAQRNGELRVAATLDLRPPHVSIKEAAFKAVVLDRAKANDKAHCIGIYASPPGVHLNGHAVHLRLLEEYSDEVYNWADVKERREFIDLTYRTLPSPGSLIV